MAENDRQPGHIVVVTIPSNNDSSERTAYADELRKAFVGVLEGSDAKDFILDCQNVELSGDFVWREVLRFFSEIHKRRGRLALIGLSDDGRDVIRRIGIAQHMTLHKDVTQAMTALRGDQAGPT